MGHNKTHSISLKILIISVFLPAEKRSKYLEYTTLYRHEMTNDRTVESRKVRPKRSRTKECSYSALTSSETDFGIALPNAEIPQCTS